MRSDQNSLARCTMKRVLLGVLFPACCMTLIAGASMPAAADPALPTKARGEGSIKFAVHDDDHHPVADDDNEDGRGYLLFDVERKPGGFSGSLLFAAEEHHGLLYPDIIVRVGHIDSAEFGRRQVKITTKGKLHDETVTVSVIAFDGQGTDEHDRFAIKCANARDEIVFSASGELFAGDVVVGEPQ